MFRFLPRRLSLRSLALSTCLAGAALAGAALPAGQAQANPIERVMSVPTGWLYYYGITAGQLSGIISSGYRIVDLQVEGTSTTGPAFTVALVANTGAYAKGWWWYYGQSLSQVSAALSANNARLISIAPYVVNGTTYFASVMVPNTGADAKGWYWWVGTASQINAAVSSTSARLVDLEPYATSSGTQYVAIAISNTGADADSWWWYLGDSVSSLLGHVNTNKAQLLTFNNEPGSSALDSTMQGGSTAPWWFYTGVDASLLGQLVAENGARLTELRSVFNNGIRSFNAVMINNSDACTTRLIGIGHANGTGWNGNYVHEISGTAVTDGPTPCAANDSRVFEPASAIKVVLATYVWSQVQNGLATMNDKVPVLDPNNFCNFAQTGTETLGNAVKQMMQNSDNARTDMLLNRYGLANVTSYAHSIGMPNTAFNGYIDCPGQHNTLTLDDAATLYTELGKHTVLNAGNVSKLYAQMAGRAYDFAGMWNDLQPIITQEAPSNLTSAQLASWIAGVTLHYKSGGYIWPGGVSDVNGQTEYGDVGIDGIVSLPNCSGTKKVARTYVFGFFHESTASDSDQTPVFNAMGAGAELLREQVHQALSHWKVCS
jgi:hypothetical protein